MDKQNWVDAQQHPSQTAPGQPVTPLKNTLSPSLPQGSHRKQKDGLEGIAYPTEGEIFERRSHSLMPLLGYGLLLLGLFDYIAIVFPPRFGDPSWELQTVGDLVEHAAIPLLGLLFVFYRDQGYMSELEKNLLAFLSWVCLLCGLLYLLMLPLGIANTWRIYQADKAEISTKTSIQHQKFQKAKGQLEQAKTDEQIKQVVSSLIPQLRPKDVQNPQASKEQFLAQLSKSEREMQTQADQAWSDQSQTLLKNSLKWNLGALVAGTLLALIWHLTDWARSKQY